MPDWEVARMENSIHRLKGASVGPAKRVQARTMTAGSANIGGNYYDKYGSSNPIARRLMRGFLEDFDTLVAMAGPDSAFEVGCGEGELSLRLLERGIAVRGFDPEQDVVATANANAVARGLSEAFTVGSVYDLQPGGIDADLIFCCEVLEHVPDPEEAIRRIAQQGAQYVLLSVPREPVWRVLNMARGRYLAEFGNTPGHVNHWSRAGFMKLVSAHLEIVATRSPLPWTMLLCRSGNGT